MYLSYDSDYLYLYILASESGHGNYDQCIYPKQVILSKSDGSMLQCSQISAGYTHSGTTLFLSFFAISGLSVSSLIIIF